MSAKAPDTAGAWALRRVEGLSPSEERDLNRWLASDPAHARALAQTEQVISGLRRPRESCASARLRTEVENTARKRDRRTGLAGLGLVAILVLGLVPLLRQPARVPSTVVARPDRQVLPDGSVVHRNAGAEIVVAYAPEKRAVTLLRGQALFSVGKDANRPFLVTASGVSIQAIGTEFSVSVTEPAVEVLVTEGRIAVRQESDSEPLYVAAGGKLSISAKSSAVPAVVPVTSAEQKAALSWRESRVEFNGTTLNEAIALFNERNPTKLELADPSLGSEQMTGIFWSDNPQAFASLVELTFPIKAERASPGKIVLRSAGP